MKPREEVIAEIAAEIRRPLFDNGRFPSTETIQAVLRAYVAPLYDAIALRDKLLEEGYQLVRVFHDDDGPVNDASETAAWLGEVEQLNMTDAVHARDSTHGGMSRCDLPGSGAFRVALLNDDIAKVTCPDCLRHFANEAYEEADRLRETAAYALKRAEGEK